MLPAFTTLITIAGGALLSMIFCGWRHWRHKKSWSNEVAVSFFMNSMTLIALFCLCFNVVHDIMARSQWLASKSVATLNTISIEGNEPLILTAFAYSTLMVIGAIRRAMDG